MTSTPFIKNKKLWPEEWYEMTGGWTVLEPLLRQPVKKWNRKQSFKIFIFHLICVDAEFYRSEDSSDF